MINYHLASLPVGDRIEAYRVDNVERNERRQGSRIYTAHPLASPAVLRRLRESSYFRIRRRRLP